MVLILCNLLQTKALYAEDVMPVIPKNKFDLSLSRPLALAYLIENKQFYLNQPMLVSGVRPAQDKPQKATTIMGQKTTDQDWVLEDGVSAIWVSGVSAPGYADPIILAARFEESNGVLFAKAALLIKPGSQKKTILHKGEYIYYPLPGSKSNTCPVKLAGDSVEIVYYDPFESVILQGVKSGAAKLEVFSQWWNSSDVKLLTEYEVVVE
jgi:hypothetical protein